MVVGSITTEGVRSRFGTAQHAHAVTFKPEAPFRIQTRGLCPRAKWPRGYALWEFASGSKCEELKWNGAWLRGGALLEVLRCWDLDIEGEGFSEGSEFHVPGLSPDIDRSYE